MSNRWMQEYEPLFAAIAAEPPFSLSKQEKQARLLTIFNILHKHHRLECREYNNIAKITSNGADFVSKMSDLDYLSVRLFKQYNLRSIANDNVFKVLNSSGTTSHAPSKVNLDKETSARQSKTLVSIMQSFIGKQRLPMLIIDSEQVAKGRDGFSARTAGIQGMFFFGRKHVYALDNNMQARWDVIDEFFLAHQNTPVLIFGFTFMVWKYFVLEAEKKQKRYATAEPILIHSGGWKKLEAQKVDNEEFKERVTNVLSNARINNFYGMAEQVGSVHVECEKGHLHAPNFADILIRDPYTLELTPNGQQGLVQSLSLLPTSYPGHSILTEDLGLILGEDDCACGRKGKYFKIVGRLPKTEVRGCSDTHV